MHSLAVDLLHQASFGSTQLRNVAQRGVCYYHDARILQAHRLEGDGKVGVLLELLDQKVGLLQGLEVWTACSHVEAQLCNKP